MVSDELKKLVDNYGDPFLDTIPQPKQTTVDECMLARSSDLLVEEFEDACSDALYDSVKDIQTQYSEELTEEDTDYIYETLASNSYVDFDHFLRGYDYFVHIQSFVINEDDAVDFDYMTEENLDEAVEEIAAALKVDINAGNNKTVIEDCLKNAAHLNNEVAITMTVDLADAVKIFDYDGDVEVINPYISVGMDVDTFVDGPITGTLRLPASSFHDAYSEMKSEAPENVEFKLV